jgi:hypothetical protein
VLCSSVLLVSPGALARLKFLDVSRSFGKTACHSFYSHPRWP